MNQQDRGPAVPRAEVVELPDVNMLALPLTVGHLIPLDEVKAGQSPLNLTPERIGLGEHRQSRLRDMDEGVVSHQSS